MQRRSQGICHFVDRHYLLISPPHKNYKWSFTLSLQKRLVFFGRFTSRFDFSLPFYQDFTLYNFIPFEESIDLNYNFCFFSSQPLHFSAPFLQSFDYAFGTVGFAFSLPLLMEIRKGYILPISKDALQVDGNINRLVVFGDPAYEEPDFNLVSYEVEWEWGVPYQLARLRFEGEAAPDKDDIIEIYESHRYSSPSHRKRIFGGRILSKQTLVNPPARISHIITAVSAGYTLTQQYINSSTSLLIPGDTPNPKEYIKEWLGGSSWRMTTGCEPKWISSVPNWRSEYAYNYISFSPARTTKWEAISMICDRYNMVAWTKPSDCYDWNEFRFYTADSAKSYFNKVLNVSADECLKSLQVFTEKGKWYRYNTVRVFSSESGDWDYFWSEAKSHLVQWKDVRPIEYNWALPDLENPENASVWAHALLERFQESAEKIIAICRILVDHPDSTRIVPGHQIRFKGTILPDDEEYRIYKIAHRRSQGAEAETIFECAKWDDLSHPYVPEENPFRRLREEVYEKILRATRATTKAFPSTLIKSHSSAGAATGSTPCEIVHVYDDGTADVKILATNQIIKRVKIL
ncbi:MAG: hypothetical protein QIT35_gp41 [Methanophagales virus PBV299]|uniref:Capsid protein n=1 Tax=Methanophagales virus PBV299 TaxID=2987730 RepID=A0ABY6GLF2_9CAUD|nr:MAG: hypothetical protein QIT35_gp41 [Methanophagales virus PBV299]UYL64837.1 MAG: hypothetical protein OFDIEDLO_00041 [Methanophagales virus PBV299]